MRCARYLNARALSCNRNRYRIVITQTTAQKHTGCLDKVTSITLPRASMGGERLGDTGAAQLIQAEQQQQQPVTAVMLGQVDIKNHTHWLTITRCLSYIPL